MNRRESPRMEVKLNCHVSSSRSWPKGLTGITENISRHGVLMNWSLGEPSAEAPRVGELVTVEIELPANHVFNRKCIQCQATVVRVAPIEKDLFRVAFSINQMKFGELMTRITHLSDVEVGTVQRPV